MQRRIVFLFVVCFLWHNDLNSAEPAGNKSRVTLVDIRYEGEKCVTTTFSISFSDDDLARWNYSRANGRKGTVPYRYSDALQYLVTLQKNAEAVPVSRIDINSPKVVLVIEQPNAKTFSICLNEPQLMEASKGNQAIRGICDDVARGMVGYESELELFFASAYPHPNGAASFQRDLNPVEKGKAGENDGEAER